MRITITTTDTALTFMRRAGYGFQKETSGEVAFVRRVSGSPFPRYHAYVREVRGTRGEGSSGGVDQFELEVNLHVDQKAPTYQQDRVHSGEYDGPLVEQEATRLRSLTQQANTGGHEARSGEQNAKRKGFWGRLLG